MDDLKERIKTLLEEIEYVDLKKTWPEHLIAVGIDEREVHKWAAEIGHVVAEYQNSLKYLIDLLQETNPERIPRRVNDWADYTRDISVFIFEGAMRRLQEQLEKYLPPTSDDEDKPS